MLTFKKERVVRLIKKEISYIIQNNRMKDPRITAIISVSEVELSTDMRIAKTYISIYGLPKEIKNNFKYIRYAASKIRYLLAKRLNLKYIPYIEFYLDRMMDKMDHLNDLFKKI